MISLGDFVKLTHYPQLSEVNIWNMKTDTDLRESRYGDEKRMGCRGRTHPSSINRRVPR